MTNLLLNIECMAGTSVDECCADMIELARKLDVMVAADFNGVRILAHGKDEWDKLAHQWEQKLKGKAS